MSRAIERIAAEMRRSPHVRTMREAKHLALELVEALHGSMPDVPRVRVGGVNYPSWSAAGRAVGVALQALQQHVMACGTEEPYFYKKAMPKPIRVGGVDYPHWLAAERALGVSYGTLQKHVKRAGTECVYVRPRAKIKQVRVGGVNYTSLSAAERALGVAKAALRVHVERHGPEVPYFNKRYSAATHVAKLFEKIAMEQRV